MDKTILINKSNRLHTCTSYNIDTIKPTSCPVFALLPDLTFNSEYPSTIKWIINLWHLWCWPWFSLWATELWCHEAGTHYRATITMLKTNRILIDSVQRSKLTFSKGCLLATFNCKMVAIKNIQSPKRKKTWGHFMTYYTTTERGRHFII